MAGVPNVRGAPRTHDGQRVDGHLALPLSPLTAGALTRTALAGDLIFDGGLRGLDVNLDAARGDTEVWVRGHAVDGPLLPHRAYPFPWFAVRRARDHSRPMRAAQSEPIGSQPATSL